jgi:protein TonB
MIAPPDIPGLSNSDRLGLALFGAALAHIVVILGVTFSSPKRATDNFANLEITLVQTHSDQSPIAPQFLAQANQDGGGESDLAEIARSPFPLQEMSEKNNDLPIARKKPQKQVLSARELSALMTQPEDILKNIKPFDPKPEQRNAETRPENLGLIEQNKLNQERARLTAEISRFWQEYQKRPQRKFLNARTQEYKYAIYMDAWRAKVERIGNLNYPSRAKSEKLSGNLLLDVAINADGTVNAITVRRSSGNKLLDDFAIRAVELAAPFDPFPPDIRAEGDNLILHITRTWKFRETALYTEEN